MRPEAILFNLLITFIFTKFKTPSFLLLYPPLFKTNKKNNQNLFREREMKRERNTFVFFCFFLSSLFLSNFSPLSSSTNPLYISPSCIYSFLSLNYVRSYTRICVYLPSGAHHPPNGFLRYAFGQTCLF